VIPLTADGGRPNHAKRQALGGEISATKRETTVAKFKVTLLVIALATVTTFSQEARDGPVWFWFATCGGPLMTLELRLDNRMVHKSTFPLCRANREAIQRQGQDGRIEFTWRPGRMIVWQGYRESDDRTTANGIVEANIWEAGADSDTLTLGVSFVSGKKVVMNTVHLAHPTARDESAIAKGLLVLTYPAAK
jgi:hypothetical protein